MSKMQNWNTVQTTANYVEPSNWYNNMFAANIKREPGTVSPQPSSQSPHLPAPSTASSTSHLGKYIKQHQQQFAVMDTNMTPLTPSPHSISDQQQQQTQQFFDSTGLQQHHQQMIQQQQFQQHFQQAQQAAAQNQITSHLPLGFNPLTPPGLPQAVLPAMSHFYTQSNQQPQISSPQLLDTTDKSALTPRHTPPMDVTPPKSPKVSSLAPADRPPQDQELVSNSSEELKSVAESEEDEQIRQPIYNSHGKMKNYKCKSCGMITVTKIDFWEHARIHMKPEKMLQCNKCPFVTELKHHLEYHTRKHKNLKPFQCDSCSYTCVNKSMLNSHRKSHSSVYQYRCTDCDYATKYCHSFKLHLRKYEHNPGVVLDEEGLPNPSVVIDVYGTRRGPKNKGSSGNRSKRYKADLNMEPSTSQLAAALQGFHRNSPKQLPVSPAKSSSPAAVEMPNLNININKPMPQQQQQQQQQQLPSPAQMSPNPRAPSSSPNANMTNLLPPLATLLQQNHNMAFLPYWNINLQMLAAQQQAAVLAQLSPRMREQFQKQQLEQNLNQTQTDQETEDVDNDNDDEEEEEEQEFEHGSVDSAMDLSQGTPSKEDAQQQQTPEMAMNLKMPENNVETPLVSNASMARRKGRVLKLDHEQMKNTSGTALNSAATSPAASSPLAIATPINGNKIYEQFSTDESMETDHRKNNNNPTNTSSTSTASSSGNSSNSSATGSSSSNSLVVISSSPIATPTMFECRYCDIYFKDAVLYTIHMGYHSCDDVFKCNMCGEKCDGPVGLFVHMARNAHS